MHTHTQWHYGIEDMKCSERERDRDKETEKGIEWKKRFYIQMSEKKRESHSTNS